MVDNLIFTQVAGVQFPSSLPLFFGGAMYQGGDRSLQDRAMCLIASIIETMHHIDLCWLAGFLEGEGSFLKGTPSQPNMPAIAVVSTDLDVITRAATLLNNSSVFKASSNKAKAHWKQAYRVQLRGRNAVLLMQKLYPLMGFRRKQQIIDAIATYKVVRKKCGHNFDDAAIRAIRDAKGSNRDIAAIFGIDHSTVSRIKRRISYKDVE